LVQEMELAMAKVWVQLWTAKVAGSVQVEESELAKVAGLEKVKPLVPMLVEVREKEWELVPSVLVKESPLVQVSGVRLELARLSGSRGVGSVGGLRDGGLGFIVLVMGLAWADIGSLDGEEDFGSG
jgi:hypothetical protein